MKQIKRSMRWLVVMFVAVLINGSPNLQWNNTGLFAADDCGASGACVQEALQCFGACSFDAAETAFETHIGKLPKKEQDLYRQTLDGLSQNEKLEYYRRVTLARLYFADNKFPWDDRGKAYVLLGPPAHVSRSNSVRMTNDYLVMATRESFAARLSSEVVPGFPTFPVEEELAWEYWVYPNVLGGIELTFVETFDERFVFAPLPGGFDRPAPTKLIGYQSQFLYEKAQKDSRATLSGVDKCKALITANIENLKNEE